LLPPLLSSLSLHDALPIFNFLYNVPTRATWNGFAKALLGGWQFGSIFTASTGSPMTVLLNNDRAGTKSSQTSNLLGQRPNYVARSEEHTSELQSRGHLVCR